jgi:LacI family transcriptional regulator
VALGPGADGVRSVPVDNRGGGAALGAALAARGYRDATVLAAREGVRTSDERAAGFAAGFAAGGGTVRRRRHGGFTREDGRRLAEQELAAGLPPGTLLVAVADVIALGALEALRAAGRAVGGDVALCGFDDVPAARDVTPGLTTVRVPLEELGHEAVRAVADDDWQPGRTPLPLEVVVRDSTPGLS